MNYLFTYESWRETLVTIFGFFSVSLFISVALFLTKSDFLEEKKSVATGNSETTTKDLQHGVQIEDSKPGKKLSKCSESAMTKSLDTKQPISQVKQHRWTSLFGWVTTD